MKFNKGDCVAIDTYATGHGSHNELRGIIVKGEVGVGRSGVAQILIGGKVAMIPICHLKKIAPQKNGDLKNETV
tara:strand:+ start:39 stop:260 length:222 start_codon:yes stop_codon:yes gene_type:complete